MAISSNVVSAEAATSKVGRVRFTIVAMLFVVTMVNYADRATISIAGPAVSRDLGLSPVQMGYVFSAFGWSYVAAQIPGGWMLDRFGSKTIYFWSIFIFRQLNNHRYRLFHCFTVLYHKRRLFIHQSLRIYCLVIFCCKRIRNK